METKNNAPTQPKDVKGNEEDNRVDKVQSDDGTMPRGVGSTDDTNAMQPRSAGSNEMATGNTVQEKEGNTDKGTLRTNPNSEDMIGENAGGNFPNEEMRGGRNQPEGGNQSNDTGKDKDAVKKSVRDDVKKDTGTPTGAIHGREGDIKSVPNKFDEASDTSKK